MKKALVIIPLIALLLFGLAFSFSGIAARRAQSEHVWLMETLLPGGKDFVRVTDIGEDDIIRSVHKCDEGYVIETATWGYVDEIVMMIGVNMDGKVMGLVALEAHETSGLGSRILTDHKFLSGFLGKGGNFTIGTAGEDAFSGATSEVNTSGEDISVDGISGATVSSKAVARCVSAAVAYVTGSDIDSSATTWGG